jgi:SpoVK/Ycf46/Vps4 family AAA+-type ATPase
MMARAVATESVMNFIAVKGPEIFSKWVGESEQAIRDLFRKARQASPCVLFFDEIDAIATQRESGDGGVSNRVLTQLLTEMDGVSSLKQVIVIAATNRPHVLDPALLRPGRLDRLVYVGLPDAAARAAIWTAGLERVPHELTQHGPDYIEGLIARTDGYSGAEIIMAIKEAAILCVKESIASKGDDLAAQLGSMTISCAPQSSITWSHVQEALTQVRPRTDQTLVNILTEFRNRSFVG